MKPSSGRWVPWMIFGLLGLGLVSNLALAVSATSDPTFSVEKDYYRKAVDYDRIQQERQHSETLGWTLTPRLSSSELLVHVADAEGRDIDDARVEVEAFAKLRGEDIKSGRMIFKGRGVYALSRDFRTVGRWELRFRVQDLDGVLFVHKAEVER